MKLEEKTVGIAGIALLAGFILCYYLMGNASPPAGSTSAFYVQKIVPPPAMNPRKVFSEETDLRTDITYELLRRTPDRPIRRSKTLNRYDRVIEGDQTVAPVPEFKHKPNRDLIDLQYQPRIDVKDLLTPAP